MKTFIVFYNRNGNKKLAIELNEKMTVNQMSDSLSKLVNGLCERNNFTFSYHNLKADDTLLKNLPILTIGSCLC